MPETNLTPKINSRWVVKVPTMLPERANETFVATVTGELLGMWTIQPEGAKEAWSILFGREWFIRPAAALEQGDKK